jgi:hypothetical protein
MTIPVNVDTIHSVILDDWRISIKKDSRDPGDIPRKSKLYYSQDFRHERALCQMGSQMSLLIWSMIECLLYKPF